MHSVQKDCTGDSQAAERRACLLKDVCRQKMLQVTMRESFLHPGCGQAMQPSSSLRLTGREQADCKCVSITSLRRGMSPFTSKRQSQSLL